MVLALSATGHPSPRRRTIMGPSKGVRRKVLAALDSEMLVMRVLYCFLPEDQVRGKALKKLGVPSKVGGHIDWSKIGSDFRIPERPRGEERVEVPRLTIKLIREQQREHYKSAALGARGMPLSLSVFASPFTGSSRASRTATTPRGPRGPRARPRTGVLEGRAGKTKGRDPTYEHAAPRQARPAPAEEGTPRTEREPVVQTKRPLFKMPAGVPARPRLPCRSPEHGDGEALEVCSGQADLANNGDGGYAHRARLLEGLGGLLSVEEDEWPERHAKMSSPPLSRRISSSSASGGSHRDVASAADMDGASPDPATISRISWSSNDSTGSARAAVPEQSTDLVGRRGSARSSSPSGAAPVPVPVEGGAKRRKCSRSSESTLLRSGVPNAMLPDAVPAYPQPCHSPDDLNRSVSELQLIGFRGEQKSPAPVPATISAVSWSSNDSTGSARAPVPDALHPLPERLRLDRGRGRLMTPPPVQARLPSLEQARTASPMIATAGSSVLGPRPGSQGRISASQKISSPSSAAAGSSSQGPRPGRLGRPSASHKSSSNSSGSCGDGPIPPSGPSRPANVGRITHPCPQKDSIPLGSIKPGSSPASRPRRASEGPSYFSLKTNQSSDSDSKGSRGSKESVDLYSNEPNELGGLSPDVIPPSQVEESSTNWIVPMPAFKRDFSGKAPASPANRSPTIASEERRGRREVRSSIESSISSPSLTGVKRRLFKVSVSPLVSGGRSPALCDGSGTRDALDSPGRAECEPLEDGDEALAGNRADDTASVVDSRDDAWVRSPGSHLMARARSNNSSFVTSRVSEGDTSLRDDNKEGTPWDEYLFESLHSTEEKAAPRTIALTVSPKRRRDPVSPEQSTDLVGRRGSARSSSPSGAAPVPVPVENGAKRIRKCSRSSESTLLRSGVPNAMLPDAVPAYPQPCHSPDDLNRSVSELQLIGFRGEQKSPAPVPATISAVSWSSNDSTGRSAARAIPEAPHHALPERIPSSASSGSSGHGPRPGRLSRTSASKKTSSTTSGSSGGGPSQGQAKRQLVDFLGKQQAPARMPSTIPANSSTSKSSSLTSAGQLTASFSLPQPASEVADRRPKQSLSIATISKSICRPKVAPLQDATNRPVEAGTEARGHSSVSSGARSSPDPRPRPTKRAKLSISMNPHEDYHTPKGGPREAEPQTAEPTPARILTARPLPKEMMEDPGTLSGLSDVSLDDDSPSSDDSLEDLLLSQGEPVVSRRPDETPHRPILMPLIPKKISVGEAFSPERRLPPSQSSSVLQAPPSSTPPSTISYSAPRRPRQSVGIDLFVRRGVPYFAGEESRRSTGKDSLTPPGSEDINVTNFSSLYSPVDDER